MGLVVSVNERRPGVPLVAATVPSTPSLLSMSGQNRLQVTYDRDSGDTAQEFVELRVVGDGGGEQFSQLIIDWGDGGDLTYISPLGKTALEFPTHVYTGTGPYTIQVQLTFKYIDITYDESLVITPNLSADWAVDQVQIEKLEDEVLRYGPDWRDVDEVPLTFVDARVVRGFRYKYRVRFRTLDGKGNPAVTSEYSAQVTQAPWA